jgi:hypothetical protein
MRRARVAREGRRDGVCGFASPSRQSDKTDSVYNNNEMCVIELLANGSRAKCARAFGEPSRRTR